MIGNKKQLDREIRKMVFAITNRVTGGIHKLGSGHHLENNDDEHGVRIVTLKPCIGYNISHIGPTLERSWTSKV